MTQATGSDTAPRVVRVRTEVAAVAKTFDYAVPSGWRDEVHIGSRGRAPLPGRALRGWVGGGGGLARGRSGLVLPPQCVPGDHRARPARRAASTATSTGTRSDRAAPRR